MCPRKRSVQLPGRYPLPKIAQSGGRRAGRPQSPLEIKSRCSLGIAAREPHGQPLRTNASLWTFGLDQVQDAARADRRIAIEVLFWSPSLHLSESARGQVCTSATRERSRIVTSVQSRSRMPPGNTSVAMHWIDRFPDAIGAWILC